MYTWNHIHMMYTYNWNHLRNVCISGLCIYVTRYVYLDRAMYIWIGVRVSAMCIGDVKELAQCMLGDITLSLPTGAA